MTEPRLWSRDVDPSGEFWFVSDHPDADEWTVEMTCKVTGRVKVEAAATTFVNMAGRPRRNAWPITPFGDYGYVRVRVLPAHADPFVAIEGYRY